MLKRHILPIFAVATTIFANSSNIENVQILAENLNNKGDIVKASGDVLIFSPTYYITAKEVIYNKKDKTLELFNDVNILKNNTLLTVSEYSFIDFKNDTSITKPILLLDKESNLWINSKESKKEQNIQYFKESTLSSCDCDAPLWSIAFSSGDFDTKEKWVNTYNARLQLGPVPIFYSPWFGFTTDTQRRSGLLQPTIGYNKEEGFIYAQPIFIAPAQDWDIELTPQFRLKRGNGLYSTYRYVSQYSNLKIKSGYFKEQDEYKLANKIENISHYGMDLDYTSTRLLSSNNTQDGLNISLHGLNDIGYRSMENTSDAIYNISNNIITSKIDYFHNTNNYFGSTEFRYFKDARKVDKDGKIINQDNILQQLPKIKLHAYSKEILNSGILYSGDLTYKNDYRNTGVSANSYNVSVPFSYNFTVLNDFINIKLQEQITSSFINYNNDNTDYSNASFLENKHIINISTDLIKPYKDYLHAFNLQSTITIPNTVKQKGDIYFTTSDDTDLKPFALTKTKKNVNFSLNQSLFDKDSLKEIINHKLDQSILYEDISGKLSDLRNELTYYYTYGQISSKITYDHQDETITASTTSIRYKEDHFFFNLDHTDTENAEAINLSIGNKFNRYYTIKYKENYNLDESISNIKEYSLNIDKRCWGLNIKLANNLVAAPTTTDSAIRQNIIYFLFTMKPIGQFQQQYELKENN